MQIFKHLEISNDDLKKILLDEEIKCINSVQAELNESEEIKKVDNESESKPTVKNNDLNRDVEE
jgi:hypothetical protein